MISKKKLEVYEAAMGLKLLKTMKVLLRLEKELSDKKVTTIS